MRTFIANIVVLSAVNSDDYITGTAIDGNISINYSVAASSVNERLFLPESQLVVTGKLRLAKELATVNVWIAKVIAVVSIPDPTSDETAASEPEVLAEEIEVEPIPVATPALSPTQKAAATRAAKKAAKAKAAPVAA
jgi:hypothetical protein